MILSSGIIPVRFIQNDYQFLLLRCFKYWDFPKGEIDQGEDFLQAAIRELLEETTISKPEFLWGEDFYETLPYSKGKIARYYLGQVDENATIALLPNAESGIIEHHEYKWVSYKQGLELTNPRIQKVLEWAHNRIKHGQHSVRQRL